MMFLGRREYVSITDNSAPTAGDTEAKKGNDYVALFSSSNESSVSQLAVLSKSVVVRRAYFDNRTRDGHSNAVVFLLEIKRSVTATMFTGCRVGDAESYKIHFRRPKQYFWAISEKHVTKNVALIDCYDVHGAKDGDPAYLKLDNHGSAELKGEEVKSQQNLLVPIRINHSSPTVVTCIATVHFDKNPPSEDGVLYQWLRYQKTVGIDHVHMIAEDTFVSAGGMDNSYIKEAVKENYLSVDFWPRWFNQTEMFYSSQHLAYNDCLYRFMGVYDYIVFSDSDDFFVPLKTSKSIKTYLKRWCSGNISTCKFQWRQFYPDCGWSPERVGADGNLTATVYYSKTTQRQETKCGHQTQALLDAGVHSAMAVLSGYKANKVSSKEAYFAHLRKGKTPHGGC